MKLSAHYNRANIIITVLVLAAGGLIYFFIISQLGRNQLDRDLSEELEEVIDYVNINGKLPHQVDFDEDITEFVKVNTQRIETRFFDTVYTEKKEKQPKTGRAISGLIKVNGDRYKVTITESSESTEYLVQVITIITLVLMLILLVVVFITNRFILNGLWKPFYDTLNKLKAFNLSDQEHFELTKDKVDEFDQLNTAVHAMSLRVKSDYHHLKQFTENASHEMMTPLALITSKLDTLIQDETLKYDQLQQINDIYNATGKLSRLNQSLLLLVKIENNLINGTELVELQALIDQKARQFHELSLNKRLSIRVNPRKKEVLASKYLMDILFNNLFSNAIRHNNQDGLIVITLTDESLVFSNSASAGPLNTDVLFERFSKGQQSDGMGLGLTIVKNICSLYNWQIDYQYHDKAHAFIIKFDTAT